MVEQYDPTRIGDSDGQAQDEATFKADTRQGRQCIAKDRGQQIVCLLDLRPFQPANIRGSCSAPAEVAAPRPYARSGYASLVCMRGSSGRVRSDLLCSPPVGVRRILPGAGTDDLSVRICLKIVPLV